VAEARLAMLSRRKAMLAAYLADAYADRLFAHRDALGAVILVFREQLAAARPALRLVVDLVAAKVQLIIQAVEVAFADYGKLDVEAFMVSLYNQHTVQRLRVASGETRDDIHRVLADAVADLVAETGG